MHAAVVAGMAVPSSVTFYLFSCCICSGPRSLLLPPETSKQVFQKQVFQKQEVWYVFNSCVDIVLQARPTSTKRKGSGELCIQAVSHRNAIW